MTAWDRDHPGHVNTVRGFEKFDAAGWSTIRRTGDQRTRFKAAPVGDEAGDCAGHLTTRVETDLLVEAEHVLGKRVANQCGDAGSRRQATRRP